MTSPRLTRVDLLMSQGRFDAAEAELEAVLGESPETAEAHSMLAICLAHRDEDKRALEEAREGVGLAPDDPYSHYVLAVILNDQNDLVGAATAVGDAIDLDPEYPSAHALAGSIHYRRKEWAKALEAAQTGLRCDPEHVGCANLEAMALNQLGRGDEAGEALEQALRRHPENAETHANRGWNLLRKGDTKGALESFREALRLDPELDWARQGIVEALKARNPIYRLVLHYFFLMSRLSGRAQWGILIGGYLLYRVTLSAAQNGSGAAKFLWPVVWLYLAFVFLSWFASPIFDLMLLVHPVGRYALSTEEKRGSAMLGIVLLGAIAAIATFLMSGSEGALITALVLGALTFPVRGYFALGWPQHRRLILVTGLVVAALGFGGLAMYLSGAEADTYGSLVFFSFLGGLAHSWIVNIVASRER